MKEKLEEYSFIAQIVSAVAIVLSLIFVGMQVRMGAEETADNSAAIRAQVQQAMMEADKDLLFLRTEYPEFTPAQWGTYAGAFLRTRLLYWSQHEARLLDDETYLSYMAPFIKGAMRGNVYLRYNWLQALNDPGTYPVGFVTEVHKLWAEMNPDLPPLIEYLEECDPVASC